MLNKFFLVHYAHLWAHNRGLFRHRCVNKDTSILQAGFMGYCLWLTPKTVESPICAKSGLHPDEPHTSLQYRQRCFHTRWDARCGRFNVSQCQFRNVDNFSIQFVYINSKFFYTLLRITKQPYDFSRERMSIDLPKC